MYNIEMNRECLNSCHYLFESMQVSSNGDNTLLCGRTKSNSSRTTCTQIRASEK